MSNMETVTLKSQHPFEVTWRPIINGEYKKFHFHWNMDNGCKVAVPIKWWEEIRDEFVDRKANLKYREFFREL